MAGDALASLISRQVVLSEERANLYRAREALVENARLAGRADLNREEDDIFLEMTRALAELDDEIEALGSDAALDEAVAADERADEEEEARARAAKPPAKLVELLKQQDEARREREALYASREELVRNAAILRVEFTDDEDELFMQFTREIASLDAEIAQRDSDIEPLAALAALHVPG